MNKLHHLILLSFFLVTFPSFSQKNFSPGYVVMLDGDTVTGLINYKRWDKNPRVISFKKDDSSQMFDYRPGDIREFSVTLEVYASAVVDVDISPYKIADLGSTSTPEFVKDTVFLQNLIRGEKNLFFLKDQNAKTHFYIFDGEYRPLVYKQYIQSIYDPHLNGYKNGLFQNTEFKTQLARYLAECKDIQDKMRLLKYETSSLLKLYKSYYECANKDIQYSNAREETLVRMGILAGATSVKFNYTDPTWSRLKEFSASVNPSIGAFFDFKLLRTRGLTIANDLYFTSFETQGEGYVPGSGSYDRALSTFSAKMIKSNHQLRFNLFNNSGLYFNAGISVAMSYEKAKTTVLKSEPTVTESQANGLLFGPVAGIGYGFGKLSGELRVEKPSKRRGYNMLSMSLLLKYRLH